MPKSRRVESANLWSCMIVIRLRKVISVNTMSSTGAKQRGFCLKDACLDSHRTRACIVTWDTDTRQVSKTLDTTSVAMRVDTFHCIGAYRILTTSLIRQMLLPELRCAKEGLVTLKIVFQIQHQILHSLHIFTTCTAIMI